MGAAVAAVVLLAPAAAEEHPGKKLYDKTCRGCHGPEGTGSQAADKLYKTKIPRLNSAEVQAYSDQELAGIIMGGKGKMASVRLGTPQNPHGRKFTGDEIEEVIAYVRTLKK